VGFEPTDNGFANRRLEDVTSCQNNNLQQAESCAYKPAYKKKPKTGQNQGETLPDDLAEVVAVWPKLPEHIKAAIKALIQTHIRED
jgi:hypothetical protein